jgi:argininosuccinate lyase
VRQALTLEAALAMRDGWNGTAPHRVSAQIERFNLQLVAQQQWALDYSGPRG